MRDMRARRLASETREQELERERESRGERQIWRD